MSSDADKEKIRLLQTDSLFLETNSFIFLAFCRLINEASALEWQAYHADTPLQKKGGPDRLPYPFTREDLLKRLRGLIPEDDAVYAELIPRTVDLFFDCDEKGFATLRKSQGFTLPPTRRSLGWLKNMLATDAARFLLSDRLRQRLQAGLADLPDLAPENRIEIHRPPGDRTGSGPLCQMLRDYWLALRQRKMVQLSTTEGRLRTAAPCRLEYDFALNTYSLLLWEEERVQRVPAAELRSLRLLPQRAPEGLDKIFQRFLTDHSQSVSLRLVDKNNGFRRGFSTFASYDKDAAYSPEDDSYSLTVKYYELDREEVLQKILSLGPVVTVLAPTDIRSEIIRRLQEALHKLQA